MSKWQQGEYQVKNTTKYVGTKLPYCRSSWEMTFCHFCDTNDSVLQWASENFQIPYFHPIKKKQSIYVPDFTIVYVDKFGKKHMELIEIKPYTQTVMECAKNDKQRAVIMVNHEKWKAAVRYCKHRAMKFRILTENEIYINYNKKKKKSRNP